MSSVPPGRWNTAPKTLGEDDGHGEAEQDAAPVGGEQQQILAGQIPDEA